MKEDISEVLNSWPFDGSQINARLISGDDGQKKLQLRLDLGIMQMELDGRPDGLRPEGLDTWFDYYMDRLEEYEDKEGSPDGFCLNAEDCARLHQEAVQFYHRYLSLFQLGDWDRVIRDTERNLGVFEFASDFAETDELSWMLVQFTPYVLLMNTRSRAMLALQTGQIKPALSIIDDGVKKIEEFFLETENDDFLEHSSELKFLKHWRIELEAMLPVSPHERLRRQLDEAIAQEDYERAAKLRDQISGIAQRES